MRLRNIKKKAATRTIRKTDNKRDRMKRINFVKYTAFSLEILLCYIIQSNHVLSPAVFGGRPVMMLPIAMTIAVFEGEIPSIVFAVICGILADAGYSGPIGYYAILLAILCYTVSILMENYIRTNLLTVIMIGALSIPIMIIGQFMLFYVLMGYGNEWHYFLTHYVSRIVYTFAYVPVFYGINRFIALKTKAE